MLRVLGDEYTCLPTKENNEILVQSPPIRMGISTCLLGWCQDTWDQCGLGKCRVVQSHLLQTHHTLLTWIQTNEAVWFTRKQVLISVTHWWLKHTIYVSVDAVPLLCCLHCFKIVMFLFVCKLLKHLLRNTMIHHMNLIWNTENSLRGLSGDLCVC